MQPAVNVTETEAGKSEFRIQKETGASLTVGPFSHSFVTLMTFAWKCCTRQTV